MSVSDSEHENPNRLIRLTEVKRLTGLARSTIYERVRQGLFPSPIPLGGRNVGWVEAEVAGWIDTRIAEARTRNRRVASPALKSLPL